MADTVAIVSVAATSAVAIAVPFISARLERQRLRHAAHQAQVDELRRLLDECAGHLTEALSLLWDLSLPEITDEKRAAARSALPAKVDQLVSDSVRLAMRLGDDHEIGDKHVTARDEFIRIEKDQRTKPGVLDNSDVNAFTFALAEYTNACGLVVGVDVGQAPG